MSNYIAADVLAKIEQSERDGGVWLKDLKQGDIVKVQTQNTLYTITKTQDGYTIQGHQRFCPVACKAHIHGSTWGGSMLKSGFIGIGMHLEVRLDPSEFQTLTTSKIHSVELVCSQ